MVLCCTTTPCLELGDPMLCVLTVCRQCHAAESSYNHRCLVIWVSRDPLTCYYSLPQHMQYMHAAAATSMQQEPTNCNQVTSWFILPRSSGCTSCTPACHHRHACMAISQ